MNETLREHYDMAFCINLDRRTDRWTFMDKQFKREGLDVYRYPAIDGKALPPTIPRPTPNLVRPMGVGVYASLLSHLSVVQLAKAMDLKGVLIFEDDVKLSSFHKRATHRLPHLPDDWDITFWGGRIKVDKAPVVLMDGSRATLGRKYNDSEVMWCRPTYMYITMCYAVRAKAYDAVIATALTKNHWYDQLLAGLCPQLNVYCPAPPRPAMQNGGFGSDNK